MHVLRVWERDWVCWNHLHTVVVEIKSMFVVWKHSLHYIQYKNIVKLCCSEVGTQHRLETNSYSSFISFESHAVAPNFWCGWGSIAKHACHAVSSKLLLRVGLNCKAWVALNCNYAAHPEPCPNKDFRTLLCKRKTRVTGKCCFLSRAFFIPLCHMLEAMSLKTALQKTQKSFCTNCTNDGQRQPPSCVACTSECTGL